MFTELKNSIGETLLVNIENQSPLSSKEKEVLQSLDDVWGDDEDEVYARYTHSRLTSTRNIHAL